MKHIHYQMGKLFSEKISLDLQNMEELYPFLAIQNQQKKNQKFVQGSDVLVHEATFNKENKELAEKYYHSTTEQAALLAKNSAVRKLILTHISSRYQSIDYPILLEEAKDIFHNTILAEDFFLKPR